MADSSHARETALIRDSWDELPSRRLAGPAPLACQSGRAAPAPVTGASTGHGGVQAQARLAGIIGRLLAARRGERNRLLSWASLRACELAADGDLDTRTTVRALTSAAGQIGLVGEDGPSAVAAIIRSGFHRAGAADEAPDSGDGIRSHASP
jgi:hypothetical protein